jgi:xanthine dehydrogenase YagR molybdenum-binding subunit
VAIVVAESLEQAEAAAALVSVGYQAQALVATLADAEAGGGVFDPDYVMGILPARYRRGDAGAAFARAAHLVRQDYSMSGQRQHPIELASTTASWDGGRLTLWETTQGLTMTQWNTSDALGIPAKNIRVISHYLGGGFGCKGSAWPHTWLVAQAARLLGRPVRLVLTRDQMSTSVGWREEQVHHVTLACDEAGQLTGIRHVKTSATSPFDDFAEPSCTTAQMMYACPNVETAYRLVRINAMTPVFMRGVGGNSGCFAVENALDELSYELSVDPVELRLRNHADVDPRSGAAWSSKSLKQCYDAAGKAIGWADRDPRPASMRKDGLQLGYGMSSAAYPVNQRELTEARIRVCCDNSAMVQCGAQDLGTGTYTIAPSQPGPERIPHPHPRRRPPDRRHLHRGTRPRRQPARQQGHRRTTRRRRRPSHRQRRFPRHRAPHPPPPDHARRPHVRKTPGPGPPCRVPDVAGRPRPVSPAFVPGS